MDKKYLPWSSSEYPLDKTDETNVRIDLQNNPFLYLFSCSEHSTGAAFFFNRNVPSASSWEGWGLASPLFYLLLTYLYFSSSFVSHEENHEIVIALCLYRWSQRFQVLSPLLSLPASFQHGWRIDYAYLFSHKYPTGSGWGTNSAMDHECLFTEYMLFAVAEGIHP